MLPIPLPPLRERPGDIDLLIDHFLKEPWQIDAEARSAMNAYSWPGNVRELINVIQRATILADGNEITVDDLPREIADRHAPPNAALSHVKQFQQIHSSVQAGLVECDRLDDIAKLHVFEVLQKNNGNKAKTARALGIHRRKLYRLLERFSGKVEDSLEQSNPKVPQDNSVECHNE